MIEGARLVSVNWSEPPRRASPTELGVAPLDRFVNRFATAKEGEVISTPNCEVGLRNLGLTIPAHDE